MSRIGKQVVAIPAGVTVTFSDGVVAVKGKGGELRRRVHSTIDVQVKDNTVSAVRKVETIESNALWGTTIAHIKNLIQGVQKPFSKTIILEGVGYKVNVQGKKLVFAVGFSHPVEVEIPEGITATAEKNVITITGADVEIVGQFAANVRRIKPPEPYKGKGMRYNDETILRKEGKKASAA